MDPLANAQCSQQHKTILCTTLATILLLLFFALKEIRIFIFKGFDPGLSVMFWILSAFYLTYFQRN